MRLDMYLNGEFGYACSWDKLYSRKFIMEHNIHFPANAGDRGFTFQCALHAKKYVKVPFPTTIYRNRATSASRKAPTLEAIAKTPGGMSKFAAAFEKIMDDFDFFKENPVYKYLIIEKQLLFLDMHSVTRYYPNSRTLNPELIKAVYEKSAKDFGKHTPFVNWLFHRYHTCFRMCNELADRVRQLEAQKK